MDSFQPALEIAQTQLRLSVDASEVAAAARSSYLGFLAEVAPSGTKRALAEWLRGSYAYAVLPRTSGARTPGTIDPSSLTELVDEAKSRVARGLRALAQPEVGMHLSMQAHIEGWVLPFQDLYGQPGFLPVDRARMRLGDRVMSLVAADYMMRPDSFVTDLTVCDTCDAAHFAKQASERHCRVCSRSSGVSFEIAPHTHRSRVA